MTGISGTAEHWSGLCRKPPAIRTLPIEMTVPLEFAHENQPGGGAGGSGSIRRGIGTALSGMMTLNRNRQLLWFTLLAGLVLAIYTIGQAALCYITWNMQPSETKWLVLNFIVEFVTLFFLVFLLAGLVLSISSKKLRHASFLGGLCAAKKYVKPLAGWSGVLALASMLLFCIYFYSPDWMPRNHLSISIFGVLYGPINLLMEFPFNPALSPYSIFNPLRDGGVLTSWIYPSGILQALIFSGINLLLFILTPFVVPVIVLEKKPLGEAVMGSFSLMKKNWDETAACAVFLGGVAFGVFLTYLLVQAASGMATPDDVIAIRPENTWIALAFIYDSALFCFAMVMATVGGITALDLYTSAKNRQIAEKSTAPAEEGI